MEQYIPKSVLVAEIERLKDELYDLLPDASKVDNGSITTSEACNTGKYTVLESFRDYINTLEVKEVDIEKEINKYISDNFFGSETLGFFTVRTKEEPNDMDMALCAKYFFELGLKAQKGEIWQVVDNVNHPQADKNKIYCVFTKNRYILATVINHPKDEELLQWKCTEFPHHRYDMCEGDKYMQIV